MEKLLLRQNFSNTSNDI